MDYEIINAAIKDIISLINYYNRDNRFSLEVCEYLVMVFLGYYLVFGEEIFAKINTVLEVVQIDCCLNKEDYIKVTSSLFKDEDYDFTDYYPITLWDFKYGENGNFRGAIPHILFLKEEDVQNFLNLSHEFSHCLEGVKAKIVKEDDKTLEYISSFTNVLINKGSNLTKFESLGMAELLTVCIENRILKSLIELDEAQIENPIVKSFLGKLNKYKGMSVLANSYTTMSALFKDFFDNDNFFELVKNYYYDNSEDDFKEGFNHLEDGLSYDKFKMCVVKLYRANIEDLAYYGNIIREQARILNKNKKEDGIKKLLIMV